MSELNDIRIKIINAADLGDPTPRSRRGDEPIVMATNDVKARGEELGPIWWRGSQWAVTEHGLEALDGCYFIDRKRLKEDLPRYSWPQHMSEKIWVDIDDFTTAWLVALSLHGHRAKMALVREVCRQIRPRHP